MSKADKILLSEEQKRQAKEDAFLAEYKELCDKFAMEVQFDLYGAPVVIPYEFLGKKVPQHQGLQQRGSQELLGAYKEAYPILLSAIDAACNASTKLEACRAVEPLLEKADEMIEGVKRVKR